MSRTMDHYLDLPLFRASDPETSRQGAEHIAPKAGSQLQELLFHYNCHRILGLTDEQASGLAGLPQGWKRCSDLRRLGYIEPTGETRPGRAGVPQRVCRITAEGIKAAE